ncbi:ATP-grasp domain-containing protein [Gordonibacter massiliensis (ex Traore et al. 2017)]|uniref:ATP-grasp domain-containing protein n=1 Tax=Gordonibacter massiliensis (ex Traore et al. 2017) TaxID=1841863 RepID=UPI001C8CA035|nr:ATP-grasp domain-containing protein [Gordonibacter massiliensis (ex Traore et al. 2017)]MBX9033630.1 ATP-grasp domain-containing protein [Gordonibacter massiliensis (ex Traore et al. 2017)]
MAKVMVLGAGVYQVPLIRSVQSLGHRAIVVSRAGDYPGFAIADAVYEIDTTDTEGILAAARMEGVDGITTTGTDVAVPALGAVCDALGLRGISASAAARVTDKSVMKRAFVDGGISTSAFEVVYSGRQARDAAERLGYPVMIKACDVSGSRGITKTSSAHEVAAAYREAERVTRADRVVVEKYVEGVDVGFEAFISNGDLQFCLTHDKFVCEVQGIAVSVGHAFPFSGDAEFQTAVESEVRKIVAATGVDNSAIDGDLRLSSDGSISVIEVGGRCGATCIPELISMSIGIDFYRQIVLNSLGENVTFSFSEVRPSMAKLLFDERGGIVKAVDGARLQHLREAHAAQIELDVQIGDVVRPMHDGTDRYGQVIMATNDVDAFDAVLSEVAGCVTIE